MDHKTVMAKGHKPAHKGKASRMTIERAANGFTASTHHDSSSEPHYTPPTNHVFPNHKALMKHVGQTFGDTPDTDNDGM